LREVNYSLLQLLIEIDLHLVKLSEAVQVDFRALAFEVITDSLGAVYNQGVVGVIFIFRPLLSIRRSYILRADR